MDLRHLRQFFFAAETLNFSRAAVRAHVSQPAMSRTVTLLEEELGVQLFERGARGVRLTEAGEVLRQRAVVMLRESRITTEAIRAATEEPVGEVSVGMPPSLRVLLTAPTVVNFHRRYPRVKINVIEGTSRAMRDAVASGRSDISLAYASEPMGELRSSLLLSEDLCLVGPPDAGLSMNRAVMIKSLVNLPLVLTNHPNSLREIVDKAVEKAGGASQPMIQVEMVPLMLDLVRRGVGFTVLPYCAIHEPFLAHLVSAAPVRGLRASWAIVCSKERAISTAARRFIDCLRAQATACLDDGTWRTGRPCADKSPPIGRLGRGAI
jgi:LysR family transcriptional regulator, nitrogen assimilation regulatory protein